MSLLLKDHLPPCKPRYCALSSTLGCDLYGQPPLSYILPRLLLINSSAQNIVPLLFFQYLFYIIPSASLKILPQRDILYHPILLNIKVPLLLPPISVISLLYNILFSSLSLWVIIYLVVQFSRLQALQGQRPYQSSLLLCPQLLAQCWPMLIAQ